MSPVPVDIRPPAVRPKSVDSAFLFAVAGIVLTAVGTAVSTLVDREEVVRLIREALSRSDRPYTEQDVLVLITPFRIGGGVTLAVFAGLFLLVALRMRAGRGWARLLLTAFALFDMVDFLAAAAKTGAALELIWSLAGVAFAAVAVIYMYRPESTAYFAAARGTR